jgi:hypothetical protein
MNSDRNVWVRAEHSDETVNWGLLCCGARRESGMSSLGHVRDVVSTGSVEGQRELGALDDLDNVCRRLSRGCVAGQRWRASQPGRVPHSAFTKSRCTAGVIGVMFWILNTDDDDVLFHPHAMQLRPLQLQTHTRTIVTVGPLSILRLHNTSLGRWRNVNGLHRTSPSRRESASSLAPLSSPRVV